jgi:hypothetical protein
LSYSSDLLQPLDSYVYDRNQKEKQMKHLSNTQIVKVDLPMPRIIAKVAKYVMLATITGCCIQSSLILTAIASRLL